MELSSIRKYRRKHKTAGVLLKNPALAISLNLPFFIVATISLRAAAAMSLEFALIHMGTMIAALFTCRILSGWTRPLLNAAVSTIIMVYARLMLIGMFRGITDVLGMYIFLMAINGATMLQAGAVKKTDKPFKVLADALLHILTFAVIMFLISLLREYFGNATLWGFAVPAPPRISGIRVPFFGFIIMGFALAGAGLVYRLAIAFSIRETARKDARFRGIADRNPMGD